MKLGGRGGLRQSARRARRRPKMVEGHSVHRDRLLEHAGEMLDKRDRLQASEKIWGAAAHAVKLVAKRRGWPCYGHSDLRDIARYLSDQKGYEDIHALFTAAEGYHSNFYEDTRGVPDIRKGLQDAKRLVALLTRINDELPSDARAPGGRDYQDYAKRHRRAS